MKKEEKAPAVEMCSTSNTNAIKALGIDAPVNGTQYTLPELNAILGARCLTEGGPKGYRSTHIGTVTLTSDADTAADALAGLVIEVIKQEAISASQCNANYNHWQMRNQRIQ